MRQNLNWPTLARLVHNKDETRVRAILRWKDLVCPDRTPEPDNDNALPFDARHNTRPTIGELMRAIGSEATGKAWSEACRGVEPTYSEPTARLQHPGPDAKENARVFPRGANARLGDLTFRDGEMLSYSTPAGRSFKPAERHGPPKGATTTERSEASVRRYLSLRGTVAEPGGLRRPMSGAPTNSGQKDWAPTTNRQLCRHLLIWLGVDGRKSLSRARNNAGLPESDRGTDFIGAGDMWTGGITHGRGRGEASVGAPRTREVENADKRIELAQMRDRLKDHALVLDMAVSPASAAQIAEARGYSPSTAKKVGAEIIDRALDAFIELEVANENNLKKIAA